MVVLRLRLVWGLIPFKANFRGENLSQWAGSLKEYWRLISGPSAISSHTPD